MNIGPITKQIDAALPEQLVTVREFLPDAACGIHGSKGRQTIESHAFLFAVDARAFPIENQHDPPFIRKR